MIQSQEGKVPRWTIMMIVWVIGSGLLFAHAIVVRDYLQTVGLMGLRGAPVPSTPLQQPYPAFAADAQTWVRHSISLLEGDSLRLRYTQIDNAPAGREVHWHSGLAWLIASAGTFDHWLNRTPLLQAVERVTLWINPALLTVLMLVISGWTVRRAGAIAGVVVACAMVGHARIFEGFFPSYVDHHGLLTVAVLGMTLGATVMGAGWIKEAGAYSILPSSRPAARAGAIFSGVAGGLGMWVSAASVLPPIAIVGLAGLLATVLFGRKALRDGMAFEPQVWRVWGRTGAAVSFAFYLLEYFPSHLGFRLEANHPFYSAAWWGAGEIIAHLAEKSLGLTDWRKGWARLALPGVAVALAPVTLLLGGTKVFVVADPFLAALHKNYIQEFLPLWATLRGAGWKTFFHVVGAENVPLVAAVIVLVVRRGAVPPVIFFMTVVTVLTTGMAWLQSRWLLNSAGAQVCLALLLLGYFFNRSSRWVRWTAVAVTVAALFAPSAIVRITAGREDVVARRVTPKDAQAMLARDIAAAIRKSQPAGDITLLASPNSSTSIGYYGRFKTLGTLYWENTEGLKASAALHAAKTDEEAAALIKRYGVTHIAMVSEENFIAEYCRLLEPGISEENIKKSFGYRLLADRRVPAWLQMLPYKLPEDLASLNTTVFLFKVAFEQTPADALYHIALAKVALGDLPAAEADFDTLIAGSPQSFQPWLRKGELLFMRREWDAAAEATIQGIQRAPAADRLNLFANAANSFYRERLYGPAVKIYRAALSYQFEPHIAAYLAFILASAKDDAWRDGAEAKRLAEQALKTDPKSSTFLNALAAALAENGQYAEAVVAAEKARANARMENDAAAVGVSERRLELYRAGKPLRE